jgi:formate-dependent nitrite reductase cytochrome c552 subunit
MKECLGCHEIVDADELIPRKLTDMHEDIQAIFDHGKGALWCYDCHNAKSSNMIHKDGKNPARFESSAGVCSKCHASIYEDWKKGVHTKISGNIHGERTKLSCVECHNPHHPKFKQVTPEAKPILREKHLIKIEKTGNK